MKSFRYYRKVETVLVPSE